MSVPLDRPNAHTGREGRSMSKAPKQKTAAMVLAGGRGKRMGILCRLRPKPCLPFAGRFRVIDFVLSNCMHSQIPNTAVLADYQRLTMAPYLAGWGKSNYGWCSIDLLMPRTGSYAGTADAIYQHLDYLHQYQVDTVLVLAGDHVYKMDYRPMLDFHKRAEADVTVGVVQVPIEQAHRFGIVKTDGAGRILSFVEKPHILESNLVSMGIYAFNVEALGRRLREDATRAGSPHDFGYSVIPQMVSQDRAYAYGFNGSWQDIGTIESYYQANMALVQGTPSPVAPDSKWPVLTQVAPFATPKASRQGSTGNSIVSPGCVIKGKVENSVLSPGVRVEEGAVVRNSIIMANSVVGKRSVVDRCILDEDVHVGESCYLGFGANSLPGDQEISVLGKGVIVPRFTAIDRNCKVLPHVGPADFSTRAIPAGTVVCQLVPSSA